MGLLTNVVTTFANDCLFAMKNPMMEHLDGKFLIDGRLVAAVRTDIPVHNPATGDIVGTSGHATQGEVNAAVRAAKHSFESWAGRPAKERAVYLHRLGDLIRQDLHELAHIMTREQGKPLNEARDEFVKLAEICQFYAEEATRIRGETILNDSTNHESVLVHEPIGIVAAITPWNYPAELVGWKLGGALAAGCTIVIKPAEITPFTALAIGAKCIEAEIPDGVVNIVCGLGETVGQALVEHQDIRKVAFTGSSATGLHIQRSATNIKHMSLELGGNCPLIVTESADLPAAVAGAVRRAFRNCGQICISVNRIYVARPLYDAFIEQFSQAAENLTVANGLENPNADLGAMVSTETLSKTVDHLHDAITKGARLTAGGSPPKGPNFAHGHFFRPTSLADCTHDMKIMTEETFGPIAGVAPFDHLSEAVALANDTRYGLAAYIYANKADEIHYLSRRLNCGNVAINNIDPGIINVPYGGRKDSGIGCEHGREGMLEYMSVKHIRTRYDLSGIS